MNPEYQNHFILILFIFKWEKGKLTENLIQLSWKLLYARKAKVFGNNAIFLNLTQLLANKSFTNLNDKYINIYGFWLVCTEKYLPLVLQPLVYSVGQFLRQYQ